MPGIAILHADDAIVAVDKPAGLAVHRSNLVGRDDAYLVDAVREATGRTLYLAHRLDRATSGVVLLGASKAIVAALGEQFMARTVAAITTGCSAFTGRCTGCCCTRGG